MDTTATNKRIRELVSDLEGRRLIPNPSFQRRLVWSQKHKAEFIRTILENLPFPEIYIAAGEVDVDTGRGNSMLVDGQQRMTTIFEYFKSAPNFSLPADVPAYAQLSDAAKKKFLEYKVVVRDLGELPIDSVITIFERINSTSYSLNAIEISNARYDNDLKDLAETISRNRFWEDHSVFKMNEIKRMQDVNFVLVLVTTMMSDYYNRDDRVEEFLIRYNDSFKDKDRIEKEVEEILGLVSDFNITDGSRAWQRADLFSLIVETHRVVVKEKKRLRPNVVRSYLEPFYEMVEEIKDQGNPQVRLEIDNFHRPTNLSENELYNYYRATLQASNDRKSRILRGSVIQKVLELAIAP